MSEADQQPMSHADRHDLDKLARWKAGLDAAGEPAGASFPACAIFLVSGEDRASHDIFRRYRSAFEELGGGFHHLVIFGQHGVSTTQQAFLDQVGMGRGSVPLLVIATMSGESSDVYCVELPRGDVDGELDDAQCWGDALRAVEAAAAEGTSPSFDGIGDIRQGRLPGRSLATTVEMVLMQLGGDR